MRVALIQMAPSSDREANLAQARRLVAEAVASDLVASGAPDLVVLPEMWSCLGGTAEAKRQAAELLPEPGDTGGVLYEALRALALEHGVWVHGGSIGERVPGTDRLANTSVIFDPAGREAGRYRKIHLFDVTTPNGEGYRESETYFPGESIETLDIAGVPVGLAICYDVRFAELFLALRAAEVEAIILPAAFTRQTGEAHWEVLLRARAIETQAWIIACGTTGEHFDAAGNPRETYGHSMVIDPWGRVVLALGDGPGWGAAEIDAGAAAEVRGRMPVQANRRLI